MTVNDIYEKRYKQIGLKIAYWRRERGYTQEQLAEGIDVSRGHISQIEAPRIGKHLSLDMLFKIADFLEIEAYRLLVFDDIPMPSKIEQF